MRTDFSGLFRFEETPDDFLVELVWDLEREDLLFSVVEARVDLLFSAVEVREGFSAVLFREDERGGLVTDS